MLDSSPRRATPISLLVAASLLISASAAGAGNGANFVTYDHRTGEKGETEIKLYNDLSRTAEDGDRYTAQLLEFERAVTDQWVIAAYLESHAFSGEEWSFDGFRLETRYRLFDYGTPLNPVVYLEYINKKESSQFLREATGRTDEAEEGGEEDEDAREHELEGKLIFGHDFSKHLRGGLNFISEVNLKSGDLEFGYATGLTFTLLEVEGASKTANRGWNVKEVQLGAELFGGAGDSVKGLTLDGSKTEQYAGVSVKTEFANGAMFMLGGTFGLTSDSRDALFRAMIGWEFD